MFIGRHLLCKHWGGQIDPHTFETDKEQKDQSFLRHVKCPASIIKGLTVTQGVLDSHVGLLLVVLPVDGLLAYVSGCSPSPAAHPSP